MKPESATEILKRLMTAASIPSYRELGRRAQVSEWTIQQIRRDRIATLRLATVQQLAIALTLPVATLLQEFGVIQAGGGDHPQATASDRLTTLEGEYQRLQVRLQQQEAQLYQRFQQEVLTAIEPWLLQWPTVTHAVANNPDLPASRLVPLVQPIQSLLEQWKVEAIAPVGSEIPYDPQQHQLMNGEAAPGDRVKVRYTGFWQNGTLLHRAKVSPVE